MMSEASRHWRFRAEIQTATLLIAVGIAIATPRFATAQDHAGNESADATKPKIGLVLSGGSARGLSHVGVLKVLAEERIPIDVVSGTSMGSVIGALFAMGYSPERIENIVLNQDWDRLFSDRVPRRSELLEQRQAGRGVIISVPFKGSELQLPSGVFSGQQTMTELSRLCWGLHDVHDLRTLHLPFTAVATRLRSGEAVALTDVPLMTAVRASMSLPSVFVPVEIGGELYVDGGLTRNLPAQDARALGADYLIGVDVGGVLDSAATANLSFLEVLVEAASVQSVRQDVQQREMIDVLIQPDVSGLSRATFEQVEEWIRRGEVAARAAVPQLRALVDSLGRAPADDDYPFPTSPEPVLVARVEVSGASDAAKELVLSRMRIPESARLGPTEVEASIRRVYGTGLFDLVTYRVVPIEGRHTRDGEQEYTLAVHVIPRTAPNRLGVGFRYDSRYKAALLLDATFWRTGASTATSSLRARLGEQLEFTASHSARSGRRSRFNLGGRASYVRTPVNIYAPGRYGTVLGTAKDVPVLSITISALRADLFAGYATHESLRAGVMARVGHIFIDERVAGQVAIPDSVEEGAPAPVITDTNQDLFAAGAYFQFDTNDALDFPTRGGRLNATAELGASNAIPQVAVTRRESGGLFSLGPYFFALVNAELHVPLSYEVTLFARAVGAYGSGEHLPTHYYSFLGGRETVSVLSDAYMPLYGLRPQERFGRKSYLAAIGLQLALGRGMFVSVLANAGDTFDLFGDNDREQLGADLYDIVSDKPAFGVGVELGLRTRAGPLRVVAGLGNDDEPLDVGIRFGFDF